MSVNLPPALSWVSYLAVGQSWPKGDEDKLLELGRAWDEAAQQLVSIVDEISPAAAGVLNNVGGQVADEFKDFVQQLQANLPEMATSAKQLGDLGKNTGVQVEYSKYMILAQLIWLAAEIAQWAFFAPEAIPVMITAARVAVQMILRRLLISIATGVGMMLGMDAVIQSIQMLKGDRTKWSTQNTLQALESGAISGAIGGGIFGGAAAFVPKFEAGLIGKLALGGLTGITTTEAMDGIFGSSEGGLAGALSSGAIGALGGGGKRRFGGGDKTEVDPVDVHVPTGLDLNLPKPPDTPLIGPGLGGVPTPFDHSGLTTESGGGQNPGGESGSNAGTNGLPHTVSSGPADVTVETNTHTPASTPSTSTAGTHEPATVGGGNTTGAPEPSTSGFGSDTSNTSNSNAPSDTGFGSGTGTGTGTGTGSGTGTGTPHTETRTATEPPPATTGLSGFETTLKGPGTVTGPGTTTSGTTGSGTGTVSGTPGTGGGRTTTGPVTGTTGGGPAHAPGSGPTVTTSRGPDVTTTSQGPTETTGGGGTTDTSVPHTQQPVTESTQLPGGVQHTGGEQNTGGAHVTADPQSTGGPQNTGSHLPTMPDVPHTAPGAGTPVTDTTPVPHEPVTDSGGHSGSDQDLSLPSVPHTQPGSPGVHEPAANGGDMSGGSQDVPRTQVPVQVQDNGPGGQEQLTTGGPSAASGPHDGGDENLTFPNVPHTEPGAFDLHEPAPTGDGAHDGAEPVVLTDPTQTNQGSNQGPAQAQPAPQTQVRPGAGTGTGAQGTHQPPASGGNSPARPAATGQAGGPRPVTTDTHTPGTTDTSSNGPATTHGTTDTSTPSDTHETTNSTTTSTTTSTTSDGPATTHGTTDTSTPSDTHETTNTTTTTSSNGPTSTHGSADTNGPSHTSAGGGTEEAGHTAETPPARTPDESHPEDISTHDDTDAPNPHTTTSESSDADFAEALNSISAPTHDPGGGPDPSATRPRRPPRPSSPRAPPWIGALTRSTSSRRTRGCRGPRATCTRPRSRTRPRGTTGAARPAICPSSGR